MFASRSLKRLLQQCSLFAKQRLSVRQEGYLLGPILRTAVSHASRKRLGRQRILRRRRQGSCAVLPD